MLDFFEKICYYENMEVKQMEQLYHYKGYRYFLVDTKYTIYNEQGNVVKQDTIKDEQAHKKVHDIIDDIESKQVKRRITLVLVDEHHELYDVFAGKKFLGSFRVLDRIKDVFLCYDPNDRYHNEMKTGLHSLMEHYRKVDKEIKDDE